MSSVTGQLHTLIERILIMQLLDHLPGTVFGTIIDKHDLAVTGDHIPIHQTFHFFLETS